MVVLYKPFTQDIDDNECTGTQIYIRPTGNYDTLFDSSPPELSLFECVNEISPDYEETYITHDGPGLFSQRFTWDTSLIPSNVEITSISIHCLARKTSGVYEPKLSFSIFNTLTSQFHNTGGQYEYVTNDWVFYPDSGALSTWELNPWTNELWEVEDLENIVFGPRVELSSDETILISQIYMIINYQCLAGETTTDIYYYYPKTGDMDGNGEVNTLDVEYLSSYTRGEIGYTTIYAHPDVNCNGRVDIEDAGYLMAHLNNPTENPLYNCD